VCDWRFLSISDSLFFFSFNGRGCGFWEYFTSLLIAVIRWLTSKKKTLQHSTCETMILYWITVFTALQVDMRRVGLWAKWLASLDQGAVLWLLIINFPLRFSVIESLKMPGGRRIFSRIQSSSSYPSSTKSGGSTGRYRNSWVYTLLLLSLVLMPQFLLLILLNALPPSIIRIYDDHHHGVHLFLVSTKSFASSSFSFSPLPLLGSSYYYA